MRSPGSPSRLVAALVVLALAGCSVARPSPTPQATAGPTSPPPTTAPTPSQEPTSAPATPGSGPVDLDSLGVALEPFATVEGDPLAISAPDDGSGRLFVANRDGRIWIVDADGSVRPTPMIDLKSRITSGGEQGLLGIAVHPRFPADPRVFVNYTDTQGDEIVASLTVDPSNPDRLDPGSHRRILFVDDFAGNHNGGALLFGQDGYLYVFNGDGGGGGDPQENGQDLDALLGKILRLDIDVSAGEPGYKVPEDNPFMGRAGADEIWHLGVRNPWRASFDIVTGDLWFGDVGQGTWEEIDVSRNGEGGLNYGWNEMEGAHCYGGSGCDRDGLTLPVTEYNHDLGCTVIGGYVYRGAAYPTMHGAYLFSDYCSGRIWAIDAAGTGFVDPVQVGEGSSQMSSFGEDTGGELYITVLDGSIWRVVAEAR